MRLGTRRECIGNLPRVSEAYQDGTREFVGRRPRLIRRLLGVVERLTGSSDDTIRSHREFARSSPKGSGSSLGTRREIAGRRP
ncbi:hypothetical protein B296_00051044 [Ensete ventricosum]|uniref:Uncharacterized protein n=1 Tax=Ensete ventricosum TaxID=4639 RepID=A0A426X2V5_ENSVE|nr:hypothetical protein B296_00051044 [Ensete ventricosum]